MAMTPHDIRHKEFKRGLRGYVDSEVDEFLDDVTDAFERLTKELAALKSDCEQQQAELDRFHGLEETLQQTVVSAQRNADELGAAAKHSADEVSSAARRDADKLRADAKRDAEELRADAKRYADDLRADARRDTQELKTDAQRHADGLKAAAWRDADELSTATHRDADELRSATQQEAARVLADTEKAVREMLDRYRADKQALEQEVMVLMALDDELRSGCRSLITGYLEKLDEHEGEADSTDLADDSGQETPLRSDEAATPAAQDEARRPGPVALLPAVTGEDTEHVAASIDDEGGDDDDSDPAADLEDGAEPDPLHEAKRPRLRLSLLRRRREVEPESNGSEDGPHGAEEGSAETRLAVAGAADAEAV